MLNYAASWQPIKPHLKQTQETSVQTMWLKCIRYNNHTNSKQHAYHQVCLDELRDGIHSLFPVGQGHAGLLVFTRPQFKLLAADVFITQTQRAQSLIGKNLHNMRNQVISEFFFYDHEMSTTMLPYVIYIRNTRAHLRPEPPLWCLCVESEDWGAGRSPCRRPYNTAGCFRLGDALQREKNVRYYQAQDLVLFKTSLLYIKEIKHFEVCWNREIINNCVMGWSKVTFNTPKLASQQSMK